MGYPKRLTKKEKEEILQRNHQYRSLPDPYQCKEYVMLHMRDGLSLKDFSYSHDVPLCELRELNIPVDKDGYLLQP